MPPKAKIPAPIDRPLSKAYVREFTGWSTAEPPGVSDPTSLRIMENTMVNRDGTLRVRPGLRYLSYLESPLKSSTVGGVPIDKEVIGTHEAFYLNDGTKAYLFAVREDDGTVGFRVLTFAVLVGEPVISLTDAGFAVDEDLAFSSDTTYVKYLQVDNKIFALSDNGEPLRMFSVGENKDAKPLRSITRPEWKTADKLTVVHPDPLWINAGDPTGKRRNLVKNPSFEKGTEHWSALDGTDITRPNSEEVPAVSGARSMRLESLPTRTNLIPSPLHNVAGLGIDGWVASTNDPGLDASGGYLRITMPNKKTYYARTKTFTGVREKRKYELAFDLDEGAHVTTKAKFIFYGANDAQVGEPIEKTVTGGTGRRITSPFLAPDGAVSIRVYVGGENTDTTTTTIKIKDVVLCREGESTAAFHGGSGSNYFWTGDTNDSASVYHPPLDVGAITDMIPFDYAEDVVGSLYVRAGTTGRNTTLTLALYDKRSDQVASTSTTPVADTAASSTRLEKGRTSNPSDATQARLKVVFAAVPRGEYHYVDAAMFEEGISVADTYFDGNDPDVSTAWYSWLGEEHSSISLCQEYAAAIAVPTAVPTPTVFTLIATGGFAINKYSYAFFYTFTNEVGESAASMPTVIRAQRAWANWDWSKPNAAGEPNGLNNNDDKRSADQLASILPEAVYDTAKAEGATSWTLYMATWSDQDPAPVSALKIGTKEITSDGVYASEGWITMTPNTSVGTDSTVMPTKANRYNYSDPSKGGQGLVVADRMVLVNDPTAAAVIRWSSSRLGEYTDFTASKGGGYKTLATGNLFVPAAVKLWQNPQSADTITILCMGTDGHSVSYYMQPAQVASQSDAVNIMGFEETTATPGTTSPYGVEVFNNSLYHPLEDQLMKSTASNYNINHKSQTDLIRDMWERLANKQWIVSSQNDGRLYYLVHNPAGEELEDGCKGNEIWVLDAQSKTGTWSRFLIQASSMRKIEFGGRIYMSVIRPDGIYYLDPDYGMDAIVTDEPSVSEQAIPWRIESNTQGANRAHDAWCHLQQLSVQLGYFQGRMRFGLRSTDIHGQPIDMSKIIRDKSTPDALAWDIEEYLNVARDLKEWFFYAESLEDADGLVEPSFGQISLVQFRYTPVSVNVGYEYGSIETFEYGRDVAQAESSITVNGVPTPLQDSRRP